MVNLKALFVAFLAVCVVSASAASIASAQSNLYTVNHEWVQVFINQDGTIDLIYNMSITVTQGRLTEFDVGMPNRDFTIGEGVDQYGHQLRTYSYTPDVATVVFYEQVNAGREEGSCG